MREVRQSKIYESWRILAPDGALMCLVNERRAQWYVSRELAELVEASPKTIQLSFEPAGRGNIGDLFYTTPRANTCVCCGCKEGLSTHHIVPRFYRTWFPAEMKRHSSHDIVPLCADCHDMYELTADVLKQSLAAQYDAPLTGTGQRFDRTKAEVRKAASALHRNKYDYDVRIPEHRLEKLRRIVLDYFSKELISDALLAEGMTLTPLVVEEFQSHGELVMKQIGDLQAFAEMWRRHFLGALDPKFMPEGWRIDREVLPETKIRSS